MAYLLDTCTFIWLCSDPDKLTIKAKSIIDNAEDLFISDVSCFEISIKWSSKKLHLPTTPRIWIEEQTKIWDLSTIAINREHIYRSTELAPLHQDPFDRILIGQALSLGLNILSPDEYIIAYPVSTTW